MKNKAHYSDHEYSIMQEIENNDKVTQRELSQELGVSLGTVNVLMNKMVREGLIKMTLVSQKQVLYMLTPAGMLAKAKKTVSYLKGHYKAIYTSKQKCKELFSDLHESYDYFYLWIEDGEIREIVDLALYELSREKTEISYEFLSLVEQEDWGKIQRAILIYLKTEEEDCVLERVPEGLARVDLLRYL